MLPTKRILHLKEIMHLKEITIEVVFDPSISFQLYFNVVKMQIRFFVDIAYNWLVQSANFAQNYLCSRVHQHFS